MPAEGLSTRGLVAGWQPHNLCACAVAVRECCAGSGVEGQGALGASQKAVGMCCSLPAGLKRCRALRWHCLCNLLLHGSLGRGVALPSAVHSAGLAAHRVTAQAGTAGWLRGIPVWGQQPFSSNDHQPHALGQRTGADWGAAGACLAAHAVLGGQGWDVQSSTIWGVTPAGSAGLWGSRGLGLRASAHTGRTLARGRCGWDHEQGSEDGKCGPASCSWCFGIPFTACCITGLCGDKALLELKECQWS